MAGDWSWAVLSYAFALHRDTIFEENNFRASLYEETSRAEEGIACIYRRR